MGTSRLDYALAFAERNLLIAPLLPGSKLPSGDWKNERTTDPVVIQSWFAKNPGMNYAVSPGPNHAVVDLDAKGGKDGPLAFEELQAANGYLPLTLTVKTPTGGRHLYVSVPEPVTNSNTLFPAGSGIDVRGADGYVVGPGCTTPDGEYVVLKDLPVAPAPPWLLSKFRRLGERKEKAETPDEGWDQPHAIAQAREMLKVREPAIEGNGGNLHTLVTFYKLRDLGISQETAFEIVTADGGWNERCSPPWDHDELARVCENAYTYAQQDAGAKAGGGFLERFNAENPETDVGQRDQNLEKIAYRGAALAKRQRRSDMVIPEWLPSHGMSILLAERGVGKTTILGDMAFRLACDMDWHGYPVDTGRVVVYICGEDDEGFQDQFKAWIRKHGREPRRDRLIVMAGTVNLMSEEDTVRWAEFLRDVVGERKAVVVVDTWQRATAHASQNDDEQMQTAIRCVEALADHHNAPALVACHPPKGNKGTVSGSAVIENASSAIWTAKIDDNGYRKLEVIRIKGKGFGNYQAFDFDEVKFGEFDKFGRELSGVVPRQRGGSSMKKGDEEARLLREKQAWADVICTAVSEHRRRHPTEKQVKRKELIESLRRLLNVGSGEWKQDSEAEMTQARAVAQRLKDANIILNETRLKDDEGMKEFLEGLFPASAQAFPVGGKDERALAVKESGNKLVYNVERALLPEGQSQSEILTQVAGE